MAETEQDVELNLTQYVDIIARRRWIVLLIFVLAVGGAAAYAFLAAPVFRATTVVDIERETSSGVSGNVGEGQDDEYFNTQFKMIAGDTALRRVYSELKLADTHDFAKGVEALRAAVLVAPVPNTRLCDVSAESTDPLLAMKISSTLAQDFVEENLNSKLFMSKDVLDALQLRTEGSGAEAVNESLPAVVNNQLVQGIKAQIFAAEAQLADLKIKFTDSHPAVVAAKSRLASMQARLDKEVANIVQSLKTELSGQLRANNVRIIDQPHLPDRPVRPRKALVLLFGVVGGLFLGIFTALVVEMLDQTVRTQADVERRLGLPFLGLIPHTRHKKNTPVYAPLVSPDVSLTSEAFRSLRTMIGFTSAAGGEPILLVTSTVQEEGKSFVAANLAVALAQLGQSVLLVDGDLRRPRQHRNLQVSNERGLSDFLSGGVNDPAAVVQRAEVPNLHIVACGARPPNPAELLNTERVGRFIAWAQSRYARVVIDCPPVFPIADVLLWGHHVKPVVFVTRFGRTRVPLIQTACVRLRSKNARILGGVINGARLGTMTYADGRYYEQYYSDYVDSEKQKKAAS
jgi:capsular exopolysaccharide synthesis family protein